MLKRFTYPLTLRGGSQTKNEVLSFDDYDKLVSVAFVGANNPNLSAEIRTHDGKEVIVDSVPIAYLALGSGREELVLERQITNSQVRLVLSLLTGDADGHFVFTLEK